LFRVLTDGCAREFFPFSRGSKGLEILKGPAVQGDMGSSNDSAKIPQSFYIHFVSAEQIRIVAKISEKPIEFPERPFGAVQPTGERSRCKGLGLQDNESDRNEWFLRFPAVRGPVNTNQEQSFEETVTILLTRMQARDMASHGFASAG
jgi:hypothetical protein